MSRDSHPPASRFARTLDAHAFSRSVSLQEEIEKLKKNQSRRLNRKKQMKPDADGNIKPITSVRLLLSPRVSS